MRKVGYFIPLILFFMIACSSNKAENYANQACDCLKKADFIKGAISQGMGFGRSSSKGAEEKARQCLIPVFKDFSKHFKSLSSNAQKKEFAKEFYHAVIETECVDNVLDLVPWKMADNALDEILEELEGGSKGYGKWDYDDEIAGYDYDEICECMNDLSDDYCREVMEEVAQEVLLLDREEQREIEKLFRDCQ